MIKIDNVIQPITRVLTAITLPPVLLGSGSVMAADGKTYPGSACTWGPLTNATSVDYTSTGEIRNKLNANSIFVVCPIVRDSYGAPSSVKSASVRIRKATGAGFNCTLHSRSSGGAAGISQSQWDFGFAGMKTLSFRPLFGYNQGTYHIVCIVPQSTAGSKSAVLSYRVIE